MLDVYHAGCLVLQKLKTKGTQRVIVQYQQVNVGRKGRRCGTHGRLAPPADGCAASRMNRVHHLWAG
jgi:hypothetical protein